MCVILGREERRISRERRQKGFSLFWGCCPRLFFFSPTLLCSSIGCYTRAWSNYKDFLSSGWWHAQAQSATVEHAPSYCLKCPNEFIGLFLPLIPPRPGLIHLFTFLNFKLMSPFNFTLQRGIGYYILPSWEIQSSNLRKVLPGDRNR